ncbi:MAG: Rrf2 family transcriptional regulator [Bacteroidetes bacterium]|nr:Rrf2 family transcriptional regulator [Bacteroidota bacterium]
MKINTKIRYGLRTLIELGIHDNKTGIFQKDIAKNQQISEKYLDPIISSLKISGLIINAGGKKSGYILNKLPSEITMYDVYKTFEPCLSIIFCICKPSICDRSEKCSAIEYWAELNDVIINHLKSKSLASLIERHKELNTIQIEKEIVQILKK